MSFEMTKTGQFQTSFSFKNLLTVDMEPIEDGDNNKQCINQIRNFGFGAVFKYFQILHTDKNN